jgi:hypothetical protein
MRVFSTTIEEEGSSSYVFTTTNPRQIEIYIPEKTADGERTNRSFAYQDYSRFSVDLNGITYPQCMTNNYSDIDRIAHGLKTFNLNPTINKDLDYNSVDSIDSYVNVEARRNPFYPHSYEISIIDLNDIDYENIPSRKTASASLSLNLHSGTQTVQHEGIYPWASKGSEYAFKQAYLIVREDIICEFRKVAGVFAPVILTNDTN